MSVRLAACLLLLLASCRGKQTLFREIPPAESGIRFNNTITEDSRFSVLNYEYIYNGGGVGIGDFNNDSLPDIYFTGNMVPNKLYLNKGHFRFEDITEAAGVNGQGRWCKGVSVVDINNDGRMDLYVSAAVIDDAAQRKNLLYINKGINSKTGQPVFAEEAEAYGLADTSSTQMACFFDYDNDGDLDLYLLVNELDKNYANEFRPIHRDGSWPNTDKLFRNDRNDSLHHPVFTNVSREAGILTEGYGLGVAITDINNDGWKDIYVSNDYLSNNLLYINNRDGTFTDRCAEYFKHTSRNAMGNEAADINNDGLTDIIELDMAPADNYRLKMMNNDINYQTFQSSARFGYMHQYVRNTLQLNQGPVPGNDSVQRFAFSEVAYYAGIAHTDWSWSPLAIDADNDGYRDLLISNGLPRDMSDLDFMAYRSNAVAAAPAQEVLNKLPSVKISNYIFKNNGDITFTDKTKEWGWQTPTFSAGMAYADFDRDGDVDVVVNNTNMEATLLENTGTGPQPDQHYLRIQLQGDSLNRQAIGAVIRLYYGNQQQVYEYTPYRGYMSSMENAAHFGLGKTEKVDSVIVFWRDGLRQKITEVASGQTLQIKFQPTPPPVPVETNQSLWMHEITAASGIRFTAREVDFIDFNIQRLLLHKLTQYGPSLAVSDVNGDGLDDLVAGGGSPMFPVLFLQNKNGMFTERRLIDSTYLKLQDDAGICLFDADKDGDADLYIASGGCENEPASNAYADHFYTNDGKGNFTENKTAFRPNYITKSCVKAADYDNDGDLDLFVGGRVLPGSFPQPVSSILYRNDSKDGNLLFTNVTHETAPGLVNAGLVCDATWTDADNDGQTDLLLAREWNTVLLLKNNKGKFITDSSGLGAGSGWWNSIRAADLDNDGDMDYVLGNFGMNSLLQACKQEPVSIVAKDFDNNGSYDAVCSFYFPASLSDPARREFPVAGRDDLIKEMTVMKERFPNYASYAQSGMQAVFTEAQLAGALHLSATQFHSGWIENKGNLQFQFHPFPAPAQWAPVYGIAIADWNADGNPDVVLNGNEFSMAPVLGRVDAFNGVVLRGDGKGNFTPLLPSQSGFYVPANGKSLVALARDSILVLAAAQNSGPLRLFAAARRQKIIRLLPGDESAVLLYKDGHKRKEEFYYGSSFLSQSGRYILADDQLRSVEITTTTKQKRIIHEGQF